MRIDNKVLMVGVMIFVSMWASSKYTEHKIHSKRVQRARNTANAQILSHRKEQLKLLDLPMIELALKKTINWINTF